MCRVAAVCSYAVFLMLFFFSPSAIYRYRLLPYIYSGFHRVASEGYTVQRHMVFDFANTGHAATDAAAKGLSDQYMFGPALLVAPIVADGFSRPVFLPFLPGGGGWTNFYSGETVTGVGNFDVETNLTTIPLFVRAGSILLLVKPVFE